MTQPAYYWTTYRGGNDPSITIEAVGQVEVLPRGQVTPKGVCPYCQKHIGKGIHFHKKACAKNVEKTLQPG